MGFNIIPFIFIYSWADMRQPLECEQAIVPRQRRCKGGLCAVTASEKCGLLAYHQVHCCGGLGPRLRIFIPLMALSFDNKKGTCCHLCWNECRERNTLCESAAYLNSIMKMNANVWLTLCVWFAVKKVAAESIHLQPVFFNCKTQKLY